MKTIFTLCLTAILTIGSLSVSANATPFTTPFKSVSNPEPVKIISFTGSVNNEKILLNWSVVDNQEANQFEIEKSTNGSEFTMAALVFGTDKKDTDHYMFYEKAKSANIQYRVKMIAKNGNVTYSQIITPGK